MLKYFYSVLTHH